MQIRKITMFILKTCPYCRQALRMMDDLYAENPAYRSLEIEMVDELENRGFADKFDYKLVPSFYMDGKKLHEGAADHNKIRRVFDAALRGG